jgi:hypothetical protein
VDSISIVSTSRRVILFEVGRVPLGSTLSGQSTPGENAPGTPIETEATVDAVHRLQLEVVMTRHVLPPAIAA